MTTPILYSRGKHQEDAYPRQMSAPDFGAFYAAIDKDRAPILHGDPRNYRAPYIAGPFNGNGRRCAEGALPRRFLPVAWTGSRRTRYRTSGCGSRDSRPAPGRHDEARHQSRASA